MQSTWKAKSTDCWSTDWDGADKAAVSWDTKAKSHSAGPILLNISRKEAKYSA